jgi:hypothetical protein
MHGFVAFLPDVVFETFAFFVRFEVVTAVTMKNGVFWDAVWLL